MQLRILTGLLLVFLWNETALAGVGHWTSQGPPGGIVRALEVDPRNPSNLYAIVFGRGIFASHDHGASWEPINNGIHIPSNATALVVDPNSSEDLYASTVFGGVFRSQDGGESWAAVNNGLDNLAVFGLAFDPAARILYAGTDEGLFRSLDNGSNWTAIEGELKGPRTGPMAVDTSSSPSTVLAEAGGKILRSVDNGESWTLVTDFGSYLVADIESDPSEPSTLYVATSLGTFRSQNSGQTWQNVGDFYQDLTIDSSTTPSTVYGARFGGGVFRSVDGGTTWIEGNIGLSNLDTRILALDPATPSRLYTGTFGGGVFRSTDRGETWQASSAGLDASSVVDIEVDPRTPSLLYAATLGAGSFRSTDAGATWEEINIGFSDPYIRTLAIHPKDPTILYAGSWSGVYRSLDRGDHWSPLNEGLTHLDIRALVIDPRTPSTLYAGTSYSPASAGALFKSTDGGLHWTTSSTGLPGNTGIWAMAIDPSTPSTLYASTPFDNAGMYRSTDSGSNWVAIDTGLENLDVTALAVDPSEPSTLYAGTWGDGVFVSSDRGETWLPTGYQGVGTGLVSDLVIDPSTPSTIYAGSRGDGVRFSTDGGLTWTTMNPGLEDTSIGTLAIGSSRPLTLYAGSEYRGVFDYRVADQTKLKLRDGRFEVQVKWRDFGDFPGSGVVVWMPEPETGAEVELRSRDSAVLGFFSDDNWEMLIKVLDARPINAHFWVFLGAATDVAFTTTVTDTRCGQSKVYTNPSGTRAVPVADTVAFTECPSPEPPSCTPSPTTLCLGEGGRFQVETSWSDAGGQTGSARQARLPNAGLASSKDAGLFYFFEENNWEFLVKVLDGCDVNGHFWTFTAATTNVAYDLVVTDTATGVTRSYSNPLGTVAPALTDTRAFATCDEDGPSARSPGGAPLRSQTSSGE